MVFLKPAIQLARPVLVACTLGWLAFCSHGGEEAGTHWALQPLAEVIPPADSGNPIDAFIGAKLKEAGLSLSSPADRSTLIRRLFLGLHGLPPSPEQVAAFAGGNGPRSTAALIDSLLASPRYGERWAQHWLDLVRYAD
ncbi:MAG: DUF1549 domain-containing protein, partial [Akkermansiaceae bacterium]|nr:DUF1549 domain-containing protein [Akkermansiaceae bacterium]